MKKKKIIIICTFLLLIFATAIYTVVSAVESYQYDMDQANGVDILEGFGAVLTLMIGGFVVLYELDLLYTVYYFFIKPKTKAKSILNVFSNVSLLLIYVYTILSSHFMQLRALEIIPYVLFFVYIILRIVYFSIATRPLVQEK